MTSGLRVAREFDRLMQVYGWPETIVSDNGMKLMLNAILSWADETLPESEIGKKVYLSSLR